MAFLICGNAIFKFQGANLHQSSPENTSMICLENEYLKVWINPKGAELKSILHKKTGKEVLWQGDAKFWTKTSPVLFPIVGGLKANTYFYEGKSYELSRHGFARDMVFNVEDKTSLTATFRLTSTPETWVVYPFDFVFDITYQLENNELTTTFKVQNPTEKELYFSVGAHPAFAVPFDDNSQYNEYQLTFSEEETFEIWPLTAEGLVKTEPEKMQDNGTTLRLSKELFYDDALVFKNLKSKVLTLTAPRSTTTLRFSFGDFSFFGIWAAKNANFVCLEPWCGIADAEQHNQELTEKEGINNLEANGIFERSWSISVE